MAAGTAKQVSQLVERGFLRLPLAALPEADKLLLQTTGRHKEELLTKTSNLLIPILGQ